MNGAFGSTLKQVGLFKGLIEVKEDKEKNSTIPKEVISDLLNPKRYKVRLYILRGMNLAKLDTDIFGKVMFVYL